ncbi:MAG TPA: hypothetical protein VGH80_07450 [Xanthomonadaceae bacterium]|jgi:hypothetical protein
MSMSFSPSQIERLKHEAKALSRARGFAHSEALDRIAAENGYANWSLLMKHCASSKGVDASSVQQRLTPDNDVKFERFESIVREVLEDCAADGGQQFNFADVEWVAAEAKALRLLATRSDVELLVRVLVRSTRVPEDVCREEIEPALTYRPALDTSSSRRLGRLVEAQGLTAAARSVGLSRQAMEKLVTGGSRGPLFRHSSVSRSTVDKARTYLAGVVASPSDSPHR